jgi:cytochrome P450
MTPVPFIDVQAPGFSIRSLEVMAAREESWYAKTPFGIAILRYEDANELQNDKRLYQGSRRWPEHNGITEGPLAQWWQEMLMSLEGEDHRRLRRLANPAFSPRIIEALTPEFTELANQLVDNFCESGSCDFMAEFAEPYSALVITKLLGLDPSLWSDIADFATKMGYVFSVTIKDDLPVIEEGLEGVLKISQDLIDLRKNDIRDDFISNLVEATVDGERITERELLILISFLVFAGFDTTRNQLGLAMQTFSQRRDQWELLGADPDLARNAIEEVMRVNPTITWVSREANEKFEYKGLTIDKGTTLQIFNIPVGSDPAKYDPITMDITTQRAPHFGFGGGMHHCIGHYVARIDMQEAIKVLVARIPDFQILDGAEYLPDSGNTGPTKLPISFTPTARR